MNAGTTTERAYSELKLRIMTGGFVQGARLEPAQIAREMATSATPVRDALHRLAGERHIEIWHHEGFRLPVLTESDLKDLYRWTNLLLLAVLRAPDPIPTSPDGPIAGAEGDDYAARVARLFRSIALVGSNRELRVAIANGVERSHIARAAEARLDRDCLDAVRAMEDDYDAARWRALRGGMAAFHRRRIAYAAAVAADLRPPLSRPGL